MQREKERQKSRQRQKEITSHRLLPPTGELLKQISVITQIGKLKISGNEIQEIEDADFKKIDGLRDVGAPDTDIEWLKEKLDTEVKSLLNSKYSGKSYMWEVSLLATNGSGIYAVEGYFGTYFVFTSIGVPWLGRMEEGELKKYRFGEKNLRTGPLFHDFGEDTGFSWYAKYELAELEAEIEQEFFFFNNGKFIPYITYKGQRIDCIPMSFGPGIPKARSVSPLLFSPEHDETWCKMAAEFKAPAHLADEEGFSLRLHDSSQGIDVFINPNNQEGSDVSQVIVTTDNFWFDCHPEECLKGDKLEGANIIYIHLITRVPAGTHGPWLYVRKV